MTLHFSLSAEDFLQHQLFAASRSERIRLKKFKNQAGIILGFVALGILFLLAGNVFMMYCSFLVALATLMFYPAFLRNQYKNHYMSFINDAYKNRLDKPVTVKIEEEQVYSIDETGESTIFLEESEEIFETGEYFYIKFKSGQSLILPKQKIHDPGKLKAFLHELGKQKGIPYTTEINWKWK